MPKSNSLQFKKITIISLKEKKAFQTTIDPGLTVISGGNGAGKSTLIKSLYRVFGAEIKISKRWIKASPIICLDFKIKGKNYSILRSFKTISVFNSKRELLVTFENNLHEVGSFFKDLFDYHIELPNKSYDLVTPPIGYLFLPYYVDQDTGWVKNWNSVRGTVVLNGRQAIIPYHAGVKTNREFKLQTELRILKSKIRDVNKEIKIVKEILNRTNLELKTININTTTDQFEKEIDNLLTVTNRLTVRRQNYIDKISQLQNDKISISDQIRIAEHALKEIKKDYEYSLNIDDGPVECPTCGTIHTNSYVERFELIQDESTIVDSLNELYEELKINQLAIDKAKLQVAEGNQELNEINQILEDHRNQVKLKDIINNEGKKAMKAKLGSELTEMEEKLAKLSIESARKTETLKQIKNSNRIKDIKLDYQRLMHKFLNDLKVTNATESDYKELSSKIVSNEIGNKVPRMLLAYYYSFFHVMHKYSTTVFCPIVIDSPNQQAPDQENIRNIIRFIFQNVPSDCQAIIGLEETFDIDFEGDEIRLEKGKGLLEEEKYDDILMEIEPLIFKMNESRRTTLL